MKKSSIYLLFFTLMFACKQSRLKEVEVIKLLQQIRDEEEPSKLLFNVLVKEDSLIIATKARGKKQETLVDMKSIIEPYAEPREIEVLKDACNTIYNKIK